MKEEHESVFGKPVTTIIVIISACLGFVLVTAVIFVPPYALLWSLHVLFGIEVSVRAWFAVAIFMVFALLVRR